jgi:hypothetical protein
MGALRDLTGGFAVIWAVMALLALVQIALAAQMKPDLAKVA